MRFTTFVKLKLLRWPSKMQARTTGPIMNELPDERGLINHRYTHAISPSHIEAASLYKRTYGSAVRIRARLSNEIF